MGANAGGRSAAKDSEESGGQERARRLRAGSSKGKGKRDEHVSSPVAGWARHAATRQPARLKRELEAGRLWPWKVMPDREGEASMIQAGLGKKRMPPCNSEPSRVQRGGTGGKGQRQQRQRRRRHVTEEEGRRRTHGPPPGLESRDDQKDEYADARITSSSMPWRHHPLATGKRGSLPSRPQAVGG